MVENYITLSLETHLFFSRIMKEHHERSEYRKPLTSESQSNTVPAITCITSEASMMSGLDCGASSARTDIRPNG